MSATTRIVVIGTGQMGAELVQLAPFNHCEVVAQCNRTTLYANVDPSTYDVAIDFTQPSAVLHHVAVAAHHRRNLVIGTTGWNNDVSEVQQVQQMQQESNIGIVYASNFSLGMQMFFRIVEAAARMVNTRTEYDITLHEWHHALKLDSPSGTALSLANVVLQQVERKKQIATETQHQRIHPADLHVTSTRGGHVVGTHVVNLGGPTDTLTLTHTAHNRSGFAQGALAAAHWLHGRTGFYDVSDVLDRLHEGPAQ